MTWPSLHRALAALAALTLAALTLGAASPMALASPSSAPAARTVISFAWGGGFRNQLGALPALRHYAMHATFYVPSGLICLPANEPGCLRQPYLTQGDLHKIAANGNEIGGLTVEHTPLNGLSAAEAQREICDDRWCSTPATARPRAPGRTG